MGLLNTVTGFENQKSIPTLRFLNGIRGTSAPGHSSAPRVVPTGKGTPKASGTFINDVITNLTQDAGQRSRLGTPSYVIASSSAAGYENYIAKGYTPNPKLIAKGRVYLNNLEKKLASGNGGSGGGTTKAAPKLNYGKKAFTYNVGCVSEAYFSPKSAFDTLLHAEAGGSQNNPVTVKSSKELWSKSGTNKGMVSLFIPKDTKVNQDGVTLPDNANLQPYAYAKYAFQFHYNPTTIDMVYSGSPNQDQGAVASGGMPLNLFGQAVSQSTISFDIVLNRIADMKYYDPTTQLLAANSGADYSPRTPTTAEQKQIYNKGTMYDLDFLLSTVLGYQLSTSFRGVTADVGWIIGRPVEVSLGTSLHYLGVLNSLSVKHTIFNERMVPIFSTVSLEFSRLPDYKGMA
jgi:hypothetical protein